MAFKRAPFIIKGMTRDLAASKFSSEYAFENKNMRITATDDNTSFALVNEKGNVAKEISWDTMGGELPTVFEGNHIFGTPIGQQVLGKNLVLFTAGDNNEDHIYKFWFSGDTLRGRKLFQGNLHFSTEHPIESIGVYENDKLQKVYWTDGENVPRFINIEAEADKINSWSENSFSFVPNQLLREEVSIERNLIASGSFAPGVIQYAFTYYNLYGQETNIFYTSPLYYVSYNNRGASPDDTVSNSFTITLSVLDANFDYVRIYSILRTSRDAVPQVRKVVDLEVPKNNYPEWTSGEHYEYDDIVTHQGKIYRRTFYWDDGRWDTDLEFDVTQWELMSSLTVTYVDNGVSGETIDPTQLLYVGGEKIVVGTLAQKDNTLFLGDIKYENLIIPTSIQDKLRALLSPQFASEVCVDLNVLGDVGGFYNYSSQLTLNSNKIKGFKYQEYYRLGLQFQYKNGRWSNPVWIADVKNDNAFPGIKLYEHGTTVLDSYIYKAVATFNITSSSAISELVNLGYVKVRPVVVYPTINDREAVCQGVLCPTVYNAADRVGNTPFAQSSWFVRPNAPCDVNFNANPDHSVATWVDYYTQLPTSEDDYTVESKGGTVANNNENIQVTIGGSTHNLSMEVVNRGSWAEFRHNTALPDSSKRNCEIQCMATSENPIIAVDSTSDSASISAQWKSDNQEQFFVDQSILTFHSPDIEFDNQVRSLDSSNLKLRIVGVVPLTAFTSNIDIQTATPPLNKTTTSNDKDGVWAGFYSEPVNATNLSTHGWKGLISAPMWLDGLYTSEGFEKIKALVSGGYGWMYAIYPWQRTGSLNNTPNADSEGYLVSKLSQKKLSTLRFSYNSLYLENNDIWKAYEENSQTKTGVTGVYVFDSNEITPVKVAAQDTNLPDIIYYGNVDKIITYPTTKKINSRNTGYPIMVADYGWGEVTHPTMHDMFISPYHIASEGYDADGDRKHNITKYDNSYNPVSMKYKSTPHAVLALKNTADHKQRVLPTFPDRGRGASGIYANSATKSTPSGYHYFWDSNNIITGVSQDVVNLPDDMGLYTRETNTTKFGFLWLGELYNDSITEETRFGGQTQEALENNQWVVAGEAEQLVSIAGTPRDTILVKWTEGDTYYQRYDCLKTYPFTNTDTNSIIDIVSFMCETRVNIDGRYDRNRGLSNNLYVSPNNFNLLNSAYSQDNNFFTYRTLNSNKLLLNNFPNTITWTKTKTLGEEVDSWTNITLASTLDLDGNKGRVRALRRFNDSLLAFQDEGISQILYNENVQIASTTGVPIEIANSGKVSGKRYISNHIGCTNKWSICSTPNGLYFVDDRTKDIYLFNGQLDNISDRLGFHSWMVQNFPSIEVWNPEDFGGTVTYYDNVNQDVFFVTKDSCLTFNENLGNFSSFYSYEHTPYFTNLEDKGIAWQKAANDTYYKPWGHQEGDYNKFFGEYQPYWTTVIVNPDPTFDKTFNNLEFRADSFDVANSDTYLPNETFDHLNVWNEYQNGECTLTNTPNRPSTLKKKFRIWRALIPRSNENHRDRMRNPWLYLKLSKQGSNTYKTVLHDLIVDYFD